MTPIGADVLAIFISSGVCCCCCLFCVCMCLWCGYIETFLYQSPFCVLEKDFSLSPELTNRDSLAGKLLRGPCFHLLSAAIRAWPQVSLAFLWVLLWSLRISGEQFVQCPISYPSPIHFLSSCIDERVILTELLFNLNLLLITWMLVFPDNI